MIKVNDTFSIVVSNTDYAVVKQTGKMDKDGREVLKYLTYHSDLPDALNRIAKFTVRDAVKDGDMSLSEAVERITEALDRLKDDIRKTCPDVKVVDDDGR